MAASNAVVPRHVASDIGVATASTAASTSLQNKPVQASTTLISGASCEVKGALTSAVVLVCKGEDSWLQKGLLTAPSLLTSLAAVFLSWSALRYNRTKDQRARKQSISDDFWLRKVVSPVAIEPFVKFTITLSTGLPSGNSTSEDTKKFWTSTTSNFGEFTASFSNLELISIDLHKEVAAILEDMEDVLSNYCGELRHHLEDKSQPMPDRPQVLSSLGKSSRAVMQAIAKFQANVGDD